MGNFVDSWECCTEGSRKQLPKGVSLVNGNWRAADEEFFLRVFGVVGKSPKDYEGNEFCLEGVVMLPMGNIVVMVSGVLNTDIEGYWWREISSDQATQVQAWCAWYDDEKKRSAEEAEKRSRIQDLFKENGLDEETIYRRRQDLLREAGLL